MAQETRTQLKTYFQTGDTPTQGQFENLIDSMVNKTDDKFTKTNQVDLEIGLGGNVSADCSLGRSFALTLTENIVLDASNMVEGETYTFILTQGASDFTVTLRGATFQTTAGFTMVSGQGNKSIFSAYYDGTNMYCFPQVDFT
jgi:hypothetical protein